MRKNKHKLMAGLPAARRLVRSSSGSAFRPASRLCIVRQGSHSQESNSKFDEINVVLKNTPFEVVLGSTTGSPPIPFAEYTFDARLVYATPEGEGRDVESSKAKVTPASMA